MSGNVSVFQSRKKETTFFLISVTVYVLLGAWHTIPAAEKPTLSDDKVEVRKERGHRLLLPKDWPIQYENGVISPAPIEQYLSMKFNQVRDMFAAIDTQLEDIEVRLERLEQAQNIMQKRLHLLEERAQSKEAAHGDTSSQLEATKGPSGQGP